MSWTFGGFLEQVERVGDGGGGGAARFGDVVRAAQPVLVEPVLRIEVSVYGRTGGAHGGSVLIGDEQRFPAQRIASVLTQIPLPRTPTCCAAVRVIDEDVGISGASAASGSGFAELATRLGVRAWGCPPGT